MFPQIIEKVQRKRLEDSEDILKKPTAPEGTLSAGVRINSMGLEVSEMQPELFEGGVLRLYQLQGLEWMKVMFILKAEQNSFLTEVLF